LAVPPGSTTPGSHIAAALNVGLRFGAGGGGGGGGAGAAVVIVVVSLMTRTRSRAGVTPGCQPIRTSKPHSLWSMSRPPTVRPAVPKL
jgi:hypothetical protein